MSPAQISDVVRTPQTTRQDTAAAVSTLRSPESLASQTKRQLSIAFHDVLRLQLIPKTWRPPAEISAAGTDTTLTHARTSNAKNKKPRLLAALGTNFAKRCRSYCFGVVEGGFVVLGVVAGLPVPAPVPGLVAPAPPLGLVGGATPDCTL